MALRHDVSALQQKAPDLVGQRCALDLFIASAITNVSIERVVARILPFILILIADLLLISFYPPLSTFLMDLID